MPRSSVAGRRPPPAPRSRARSRRPRGHPPGSRSSTAARSRGRPPAARSASGRCRRRRPAFSRAPGPRRRGQGPPRPHPPPGRPPWHLPHRPSARGRHPQPVAVAAGRRRRGASTRARPGPSSAQATPLARRRSPAHFPGRRQWSSRPRRPCSGRSMPAGQAPAWARGSSRRRGSRGSRRQPSRMTRRPARPRHRPLPLPLPRRPAPSAPRRAGVTCARDLPAHRERCKLHLRLSLQRPHLCLRQRLHHPHLRLRWQPRPRVQPKGGRLLTCGRRSSNLSAATRRKLRRCLHGSEAPRKIGPCSFQRSTTSGASRCSPPTSCTPVVSSTGSWSTPWSMRSPCARPWRKTLFGASASSSRPTAPAWMGSCRRPSRRSCAAPPAPTASSPTRRSRRCARSAARPRRPSS
mmetsp:Transcript_77426/g.250488  ORF Transcript_77426/g.250488 Transcript_77426/m.250488 type:complete len:407 (-) Transcript_77426:141-1361(-)